MRHLAFTAALLARSGRIVEAGYVVAEMAVLVAWGVRVEVRA